MLRKAVAVVLGLTLPLPALADQGLPAGKPAGVQRAQITESNGIIAVGALVLITVAGIALASHAYQLPGATAATSTQP
ncbi:MAG TPA: hypothetical protein VGH23_08845 [Rhizomicrobium sp.]|jgi:hypothetical protein